MTRAANGPLSRAELVDWLYAGLPLIVHLHDGGIGRAMADGRRVPRRLWAPMLLETPPVLFARHHPFNTRHRASLIALPSLLAVHARAHGVDCPGPGQGATMPPIHPENKHRYPVDWKQISDLIRGRAGGRCECHGECGRHHTRCEARQYEPHPVTGSMVVLTVAHLDHQPEHNDGLDLGAPLEERLERSNLRAMCQRCHLSYDKAHHAQQRYMRRRRESGNLELDLNL